MRQQFIRGLAVILFGVAVFAGLMASRTSLADATQRAVCSAIAASVLAASVVVGKRLMRAKKD